MSILCGPILFKEGIFGVEIGNTLDIIKLGSLHFRLTPEDNNIQL